MPTQTFLISRLFRFVLAVDLALVQPSLAYAQGTLQSASVQAMLPLLRMKDSFTLVA